MVRKRYRDTPEQGMALCISLGQNAALFRRILQIVNHFGKETVTCSDEPLPILRR